MSRLRVSQPGRLTWLSQRGSDGAKRRTWASREAPFVEAKGPKVR